MIRSILENYGVYIGEDEGIYAVEDNDNKISIVIDDRATSVDDLDEIETFLEQAKPLDYNYAEIKNNINAYLISEGYLPKTPIGNVFDQMEEMSFKNISVFTMKMRAYLSRVDQSHSVSIRTSIPLIRRQSILSLI